MPSRTSFNTTSCFAARNPATVVHSPRSTDFTNLCSTLPCATQVNGSSVSGFDAAKTSYTVTSPVYPAMISATAADNGTVAIQQPASLPGTATFTVMSEDGGRTQTYSVHVALRRDARRNCPGDAVTDSRAPASSR